MKYLRCYFQLNSCRIDIKQQIKKFYGNFNNKEDLRSFKVTDCGTNRKHDAIS